MAPTTNGPARRGRGGNGGARRNAFTNAGVNRGRGQSSAPRHSYRARGNHRHRATTYRARGHGQTSSRPSLASRITYGDAGAQDQTARGSSNTSHYQSADDDDDDDDDDIGFSIRGQATSIQQVDSHVPSPPEHDTTTPGAAPINDFDAEEDVDIDIDIDIDIDDMLFNTNTQQNPTANFSQQSALFCGSQPTQQAMDSFPPLSPSPPPPATTTTSAYTSNPSSTPYTPSPFTPTSRRIRMMNQRIDTTPTRRPVNTYRGKDPIKRRVTNKKLQAIFADRPVPKERGKSGGEKMELRMGMRSASK